MAMSYHKVFKVPTWVVLNETTKGRGKAVLDWFLASDAKLQEWPGNSYPAAVEAYRNKGYAHVLPRESHYILPVDLMIRAAAEHMKTVIGPTSYMAGSVSTPANRINRNVHTKDDLVLIFNDLLSLEDPIAMSQMFQIAEQCHREDARRYSAFITPGPAPTNLLTRIADKVITIGDDAKNDIVISGIKTDEISDALEAFFNPSKESSND